jgi:hypothetical protein
VTDAGRLMSTFAASTTDEQTGRANAKGVTPVVFVHGLRLLPNSRDRWARVFEGDGVGSRNRITPSFSP